MSTVERGTEMSTGSHDDVGSVSLLQGCNELTNRRGVLTIDQAEGDAGSGLAEESIFRPNIRRIIEAESDSEDESQRPTINIVIDEDPDSDQHDPSTEAENLATHGSEPLDHEDHDYALTGEKHTGSNDSKNRAVFPTIPPLDMYFSELYAQDQILPADMTYMSIRRTNVHRQRCVKPTLPRLTFAAEECAQSALEVHSARWTASAQCDTRTLYMSITSEKGTQTMGKVIHDELLERIASLETELSALRDNMSGMISVDTYKDAQLDTANIEIGRLQTIIDQIKASDDCTNRDKNDGGTTFFQLSVLGSAHVVHTPTSDETHKDVEALHIQSADIHCDTNVDKTVSHIDAHHHQSTTRVFGASVENLPSAFTHVVQHESETCNELNNKPTHSKEANDVSPKFAPVFVLENTQLEVNSPGGAMRHTQKNKSASSASLDVTRRQKPVAKKRRGGLHEVSGAPKKKYMKHNLIPHADGETERWWECGICGKTFKKENSGREHGRVQHGNAPREECEICSKSFRYRCDLLRHQKKKRHGHLYTEYLHNQLQPPQPPRFRRKNPVVPQKTTLPGTL